MKEYFAITSFLFALTVNISFGQFNENFRTSCLLTKSDLEVIFGLKEGRPILNVFIKDSNGNLETVIKDSYLGLYLENADLTHGFKNLNEKYRCAASTQKWAPVWGEVDSILNEFSEMQYTIENKHGKMNIIFRIFSDGFAFRYHFPEEDWKSKPEMVVTEELSNFNFTDDHKVWWQPSDWDSNEHTYQNTNISEINHFSSWKKNEIQTSFIPEGRACQTPVVMVTKSGYHIAIHEAALIDYPAMHLKVFPEQNKFQSFLIPNAELWKKAKIKPGFSTPWRVVLITKNATDILKSKTILNLNEPSKIKETSWIKPMKYVGVWWEMHINKSTWNQGPKHGATTENVKKYIDFANKHGFGGVLVEGWNKGWENWYGRWKENIFDFFTPYPDYDLNFLTKYSQSKNVSLIMHQETSGAVTSYDSIRVKSFEWMNKLGINSIKTGYVGRIIPRGEWHDGQWMIRHYQQVLEDAAKNKIMVDAHEPVRPTGMHRTYPNFMSCEAGRGNEFNAWSSGNPPEHECVLPFTRLLGGPMDYTPGIFNIKFDEYKTSPNNFQVHTTLAKQLALYVTMYSPLQMASDLPEHYEKHLDAFQFIKDVPVNWSDTKILSASIGDHITIARREKNKNSWFIGSITDENERTQSIKLDFLLASKKYIATIYEDGPNAHWKNNPTDYSIRKIPCVRGDEILLKLAPGGGAAISIVSVD
jgi:glucan 1,4-alpha-glucosidase